MSDEFSVAAHWSGGFDEPGLQQWAEGLRATLAAPQVSLGLVFLAPRFFPQARQILEILRVHARIPLLAGCSGAGLVAGDQEVERTPGIALGLYALPGAELKPVYFSPQQVSEAGDPAYWHQHTGLGPGQTHGWLAFVDPFNLDCEDWMRGWNEAYAPAPVLGGLASGKAAEQTTQIYLNGEVYEEGGVALSFGGGVKLQGVLSQGCTPIGETWTLTGVERNYIHSIGNRRAYDVLAETVNNLSTEEKRKAQGNLFIGLAINEYLDDFHRGDFLIRNLLGADPQSGVVAVGALPHAGQTIQFQRRDAAAATADMNELLLRARRELGNATVYGGCLCCCNGRGKGLFGVANHDASLVQRQLGPFGLSGFFCNGEIGPVGQRNFLHGYTASLALFVDQT